MKKTIFSLYMLLFAAIAVFSPVTANAQTDTPKVYDKCEVMPQFPGGEKAMMDFIATNLKYPQQAIKDNVEGAVLAEFIINTEGKVVEPRIVNSLSPECDSEVIRVINLMPAWTPGQQDNKTVNVKFALPIMFSTK